MKRRGFTIVELLIVIVVIAILAAITVVAYNGIQQRARTTTLWAGITQVKKSFRLYLIDVDSTAWPLDNAIDPSAPNGNVTIAKLITDTSFKAYMQRVPSIGTNWFYDNDGDTFPSGGMSGGVNLCIDSIDSGVATMLDATQDDGNPNTGNIRYKASTSRLYYSLSVTQQLN